jgi:hypothetical protein
VGVRENGHSNHSWVVHQALIATARRVADDLVMFSLLPYTHLLTNQPWESPSESAQYTPHSAPLRATWHQLVYTWLRAKVLSGATRDEGAHGLYNTRQC